MFSEQIQHSLSQREEHYLALAHFNHSVLQVFFLILQPLESCDYARLPSFTEVYLSLQTAELKLRRLMFRNTREQNKKIPELIIKINIKGMIPHMHKPKEETLFKCIVGSCPGA